MKILLLSKYSRLGASSRIRSHQYLSYLKSNGIDTTISPLLKDAYLHRIYNKLRKPTLSVAMSYLQRLKVLATLKKYDALWVEYELFPWLPYFDVYLLKHLNIPYILDYDDAIFHNYEMHPNKLVRGLLQHKIPKIMRHATLVTTGSRYLKAYAEQAGAPKTQFIPTVIDLNNYALKTPKTNDVCTLGWIGTPSTEKFLSIIKPALQEAGKKLPLRLLLIGVKEFNVEGVEVVHAPWREETEVDHIRQIDIGIMPLTDDAWSRGKCGYKLIQYMACQKPVIASPVGANQDIVDHLQNGFLAKHQEDWTQAILTLAGNANMRARFGEAGRKKVEQEYCLQVTAPRLLETLQGLQR